MCSNIVVLKQSIIYIKTKFLSEVNDFKVCLKELVLTFRSCATETYEPCQIRKEAAVSRFFCVPRDSLDRAMNLSNAWDYFIEIGRASCRERVLHVDVM